VSSGTFLTEPFSVESIDSAKFRLDDLGIQFNTVALDPGSVVSFAFGFLSQTLGKCPHIA
jgi:hypothetical protein